MSRPRRTVFGRITSLRTAATLTALGALTLVSGCGLMRDSDSHPLTTLDPRGEHSRLIDNLSNRVFLVAGIAFVLIEGAVVFFALRFRARRNAEETDPVQTHGNPRLEWAWTILPALLLGLLAIGNVTSIFALEERGPDAMKVEVIGQQWWWEYRYDTDNDGKPDIITAQQMVIPANREIDISIRSNDVIHSFWIPALNGKRDAVPGRVTHLAFNADKPGLFEGTCTEYCGLSHARMFMEVKALPQAEFDQWVKDQHKPAVVPDAGTKAAEGEALFQSRCSMCHQINQFDGDLNGAVRTDLGIDTTIDESLDAEQKAARQREILDEVAQLDQVVPNPDYRAGREELTAANAPNLTHLMSRNKFAGNLFPLYSNGQPDEAELRNWLRDPPAKKPMNPDNRQGMPNLALSEPEIDKLVAYLITLK